VGTRRDRKPYDINGGGIIPTSKEREYYRAGYQDGITDARRELPLSETLGTRRRIEQRYEIRGGPESVPKRKRKLSAWNKFIKANSKKPRFVLRSGKLNLKKLGVAFRKTPAGKKKKR